MISAWKTTQTRPDRVIEPHRMGRAARRLGLAVMAQVHSHPGADTRHSDGDDELIVLPREGMFSLVIGRYGEGPADPRHGAGLHQFQDGHWVRVIPADAAFISVPAEWRVSAPGWLCTCA